MAVAAPADELKTRSQRARWHALRVASELFYANGVRAVGMEQIVERSGIAKTTIYRHFPTKDVLVEAFLAKEDAEFWAQWDAVVDGRDAGMPQLQALCSWIGERVGRKGYRGCPQLNVAAEFAERTHPARRVARRHKTEMHRRLLAICRRMNVDAAEKTAMQIALLFDGAFMSDGRLNAYDPASLLTNAVRRLVG